MKCSKLITHTHLLELELTEQDKRGYFKDQVFTSLLHSNYGWSIFFPYVSSVLLLLFHLVNNVSRALEERKRLNNLFLRIHQCQTTPSHGV